MRLANPLTESARARCSARLPVSISARLPMAAARRNTWSEALALSSAGRPVSIAGVDGSANAGLPDWPQEAAVSVQQAAAATKCSSLINPPALERQQVSDQR